MLFLKRGSIDTHFTAFIRFLIKSSMMAAILTLNVYHINAQTVHYSNAELAEKMGTTPQMYGAAMSPDGSKISFLSIGEKDVPILVVFDFKTSKFKPVMTSKKGKYDLNWCQWATDDRILCGIYSIRSVGIIRVSVTRLISVGLNGEKVITLGQSKDMNVSAQYADNVVSWLPDDQEHILLELPNPVITTSRVGQSAGAGTAGGDSSAGSEVRRINIYNGNTNIVERERSNNRDWIADKNGVVRLRQSLTQNKKTWYYKLSNSDGWKVLHEAQTNNLSDQFTPLSFSKSPDSIFVFKPFQGKVALWEQDLTGIEEDKLIYSHPESDLRSTLSLGKENQLVAVKYSTDRPRYHYFDVKINLIADRINLAHKGKLVQIVDESWDKRYYLVHISSDTDPGSYYRYDNQKNILAGLGPKHPKLTEIQLASMTPLTYPSRDGVDIPGYLTRLNNLKNEQLPTIILPHGGPQSRDDWGFDWLAQFFALKGYAVLQSNFRGSGGLGVDWAGEGGFRAWRRTINDITDGTQWLINERISDPDKVCIIGWSYGGYAALMSVIEQPERYQCVISIAGVTSPKDLIDDHRNYLSSRAVREFIGTENDVLKSGSPLYRVDEIDVPVLLFHGDKDLNVELDHSKKLSKALKKNKKPFKYHEYDETQHSIWSNKYRIDMLEKIGDFIDKNIN